MRFDPAISFTPSQIQSKYLELSTRGMTAHRMTRSLLLRASFACVLLLSAASASAYGDEPVARCHQVNAPVGLVIRSKPGTDGKRLGALEQGVKVTLAGKAVPTDKQLVIPVVSQDAQDLEASWIQISAPKAGYVLYRVAGTSPYDYLVPCK
jgi:hypothetical protein